MAQTNSERQRAYRARHLAEAEGGSKQLNMIIDTPSKWKLERLATCYGITQREMLERLITQAENDTLNGLVQRRHKNDYYNGLLRIESENVTE